MDNNCNFIIDGNEEKNQALPLAELLISWLYFLKTENARFQVLEAGVFVNFMLIKSSLLV